MQGEGHDIRFVDSNFLDGTSEIENEILSFRPDYFVVYDDAFNYLTKMCLTNMRNAVFSMLRFAKEKGVNTIVSSSDSISLLRFNPLQRRGERVQLPYANKWR